MNSTNSAIQIEEAGEEGRVQEATDLTREVERLQAEHTILKEVSVELYHASIAFFCLDNQHWLPFFCVV